MLNSIDKYVIGDGRGGGGGRMAVVNLYINSSFVFALDFVTFIHQPNIFFKRSRLSI